MRIKTILCPVDRSDVSVRALSYATALARQYVARLSVLEVIDWRLPPVAGLAEEFPEMPPEVQTDVLGHLNTLTTPARELGVPTEVGIDVGPVVRRILERAAYISADLLVVGTHGRGGFDRVALGSVAEKLIRKAKCPVMTVPPGAAVPAAPALFPTILCAVDFSPSAIEALRIGADLARRYGSRLVALHVVNWPFASSPHPGAGTDWKSSLEARARDELSALIAGIPAPPADVLPLVTTGTPRDEILACARSREAHLVVLGVSGHGAIDRALLGSTAHGVVRQSQSPVLTVPTPAHKHQTE